MYAYKHRPVIKKPKRVQEKGARAQAWVFTIQAPTPQTLANVRAYAEKGQDDDEVKYMYVALETGAETGNVHLQGYVHFARKTPTFQAALRILQFGDATLKPHVEKADKPPIANYTYIITGNNGAKPKPTWFIDVGEPLRQGKRSDIDRVKGLWMKARHGEIEPERVMEEIWETSSNYSVMPPLPSLYQYVLALHAARAD